MRPESQLQSIQCGSSSFLLDISQFSSVSYLLDVYAYQQNFLECCLGWRTTVSDLNFDQPRWHPSSNYFPGLSGPYLTSSFTNADSFDNVSPSLNYLMSSDWTPGPSYTQIRTIGPTTPIVSYILSDVFILCIIILLQTLFGFIWLAFFFMCLLHLKLEFFFSHFKYQNYYKKKKHVNYLFIIYK